MTKESRQLRAQQAIQGLIAGHEPLEVSLCAIARMVEGQLPGALVSIMRFVPEQRTLSLVAGEGLSATYQAAMQDVPVDWRVGTCGSAAHAREPVITKDILEDPRWEGFRDAARAEGLRACWSVPVCTPDGELLGTFATYYRSPKVPTAEAQKVIHQAASLVALAIGRRQDSEAREVTEQRFRSLFTYHPDAVFELDLEGRFRSCNAATARITGFEEAELQGTHYAQFAAEEDLPHTNAAFARACQGQPQHYEIAALNAAGERYRLEITNLPIVINDQVAGVYSIARDISLRKQQEEELRLLKRGMEASINGVIMADASQPDLPLVYVNTPFLAITGYTRSEVLGRTCHFLQGPETEPEAVAEIRQAIAAKREIQITLRSYRKDGSTFWNELYLSPVLDERGHCTHFLAILHDVSQHRDVEARLAHQETHDLLTGLPNRQHFDTRLEQEYELAQQHGEPLVVLYIDLDNFKPINDGLGHQIGDQLLVAVVRRLQALLSPGDSLARVSGDEFVMLLPGLADEEAVLLMAENILERLSHPFTIDAHRLHISGSIGIASSCEGVDQPHELIQHADLAMQEAKQQGRNTWQWYGGHAYTLVSEHVALRRDLQEAIRDEQFEVHYQPIVDTLTGQLSSVEALVRWRHPSKGMISPGVFIPLAEQTGQIIAIGRWVLRQACRDMVSMQAAGGPAVPVAVNISPLQFRRAGFLKEVQRILAETGLPPSRLELEVTEGVLMSGADKAIELLEALRALGLQVAIDDFGTGFSSLSYLRQLPINKVKLDRSFIHDITTSRDSAAIVQGVITMAHHLGLRVVAEGVETHEQQQDLKHRRCDLLQGFLFSKPVPLDTLLNLAARLPVIAGTL